MTDNNPIKRMHYFDHQFLREKDFADEQAYHIRMRRRHTRHLHTWGIANDEMVLSDNGASHVKISKGMAVDRLGQEIVLLENTDEDLSDWVGQDVYITITHVARETDQTNETGVTGYTRTIEEAKIEVSKEPPVGQDIGMKLILGRVTVGQENSTITDGQELNRRQVAGAQAGDLEAHSVRVIEGANVATAGAVDVRQNNKPALVAVVGSNPNPTLKNAAVNAVSYVKDVLGLYARSPNPKDPLQGEAAIFDGPVRVNGVLTTESKVAYVVDTFVNASGQRLRTGDVVRLKGTPVVRFYGSNNKIPIAEVTLADKESDSMVIGIVDHAALPDPDAPAAGTASKDPTLIEDGGELFVVTLGAYAHCKVDATKAPIEVGDLLTSAANPGHAMKATEPKIGSIIGKALEPLAEGTGYIAVFVNIQ